MDLIDEGIATLRKSGHLQCKQALKNGEMRCAEGIFADILIREKPERFRWGLPKGIPLSTKVSVLLDTEDRFGTTYGYRALHPDHWNELHPLGAEIVRAACFFATEIDSTMGDFVDAETIATLNDYDFTFDQIADCLEKGKKAVEKEFACAAQSRNAP